jgi:hypothetical protein
LLFGPGRARTGSYPRSNQAGSGAIKPTANTRFKRGETLYTYFEVYEPLLAGQSPATVQIQMRIVDVKTGELKTDPQPLSATPYAKAGSPVIPIGRGIDISKLPTGSYRLEVQANDSAGKSTPWPRQTSRSSRFRYIGVWMDIRDCGPTRVVERSMLSCTETTKSCTLAMLPVPTAKVPSGTLQIH